MKFIFPQNYKFCNKLFGVIDYTTAIINLIWYIIVFFITNAIFSEIKVKIFIFVLFCFPFFLISIVSSNKENIFSVIIYIIKFFKNSRVYLYEKKN